VITGQGVESAPSARWWEWAGWGFPGSLGEVRFRDVAVILVVGFTVWGYVDVSRRGRIDGAHPEYHRTDFTVFTEAGAAFFDGRDPYRVTNPRGWSYIYPPLFALMMAPLSVLDTRAQVTIWYAVSVALGFGCYFESRRLWRLLGAPRGGGGGGGHQGLGLWAGGCAGLAVAMPAFHCLQHGQVAIALLYPLLLGFRLTLGGRSWWAWWLGGVVLAWPVVVKVIPALPVGFLLAQHWASALASGRPRAPGARGRAASVTLGVAFGGLLFALAVPAACIGWGENLRQLQTWSRKVATSQDMDRQSGSFNDSTMNQSLLNAAHLLSGRFHEPEPHLKAFAHEHWLAADMVAAHLRRVDVTTDRVAQATRAAVLALLLAVGLAAVSRYDAPGLAATFGLACVAILLVSPIAWSNYYVLLLPAVLFVPLWLEGRGLPRTARLLAACPAALTWAHYAAPRVTGAFGLLGLGTTAWFLAVCGLAVWTRPRTEGPAAPGARRVDNAHDLPSVGHRQAAAAGPSNLEQTADDGMPWALNLPLTNDTGSVSPFQGSGPRGAGLASQGNALGA
jgi:hypothetical protein